MTDPARDFPGGAGRRMPAEPTGEGALGLYLRDLRRLPRLTRAEEDACARQIDAGRQAAARLAAGPVAPTEETVLRTRMRQGREARAKLIEGHLGLVFPVVKAYRGYGLPLEDLIQEANLALLRAADTYDGQRGVRFSTYATCCIRRAVQKSIPRQLGISSEQWLRQRQVQRQAAALDQALGRAATNAEIARSLGLSPAQVETARAAQPPLALEEPLSADLSQSLGESLVDPQAPDPLEGALERETRREIEHALGLLPPRAERVVRLGFGLGREPALRLREIGRKLGVGHERTRQIQKQALDQLRGKGPWRDPPVVR